MNNNSMILRKAPRESGAALIYALALLGLLLIMLMGFLASSILEQRTAYNQSSQVGANLLARSALIKVRAQLEEYDVAVWMLNRSTEVNQDSKVPLIAPIVSLDNKNDAENSHKTTSETEAFEALKPLLDQYGMTENFFPVGVKLDYPEWINYYVSDGTNRRLTGRIAYAVIPNLGIDPVASVNVNPTKNIYPDFRFVTDSGLNALQQKSNWLSLDFMASEALDATNEKGNTDGITLDSVKNEFYDPDKVSSTGVVNYYFTAQQKKFTETAWNTNTQRTDLSGVIDFTKAHTLVETVEKDPDLQNQIAANWVDYVDSDSEPTSGTSAENLLTPSDWWTTPPAFTGNEKTLYVNQIVPMVMYSASGTIEKTEPDEAGYFDVTQTVTTQFSGSAWAELINMYRLSGSGQYGVLDIKNLNVELQVEITVPEEAEEEAPEITVKSPYTLLDDKLVNVTFQYSGKPNTGLIFNQPDNAETFYVEPSNYNISFAAPQALVVTCKTKHVQTVPPLELNYKVTKVSFDAAQLSSYELGFPVDYVSQHGWTGAEARNLVMLEGITPASSQEGVFATDWEIKDARCNLTGWTVQSVAWHDSANDAMNAIPNRKSKNQDAKPKNVHKDDDVDWDGQDEPAEISTAYIRNGAMETLGELGYIHRGVPYQTLNLKSARNPLDDPSDNDLHSYANDAQLLDRVRLGGDSETYKINVNAPWFNASLFQALLFADNQNYVQSSTLTAAQVEELAKWIARKCHNAKNDDPDDATSECYPHYVHRAMLANVITDWAKKGSTAGNFGENEAQLEELIGKIVPLVRCGDAYEYFTVFAVAQSIKDVGSTSGDKMIYKYDEKGKHAQKCKYGELDYDGDFMFDEITGVSYLVARVRREIETCENTDNCQKGIHEPGCKFKIKVLESYVIDNVPSED